MSATPHHTLMAYTQEKPFITTDRRGVRQCPSNSSQGKTQPSSFKIGYLVWSELHIDLFRTNSFSYQGISKVEHYKSGIYSAVWSNSHIQLLWTHSSHAWTQATEPWLPKNSDTPYNTRERVLQNSSDTMRSGLWQRCSQLRY